MRLNITTFPIALALGLAPVPGGVSGSPGPIVTKGGLVFLTGGGSTLYALDTHDGGVLWEIDLGTTGYAVPMTYQTRTNRQYVVIATGAGEDASLKAFALRN